MIVGQVLPDRLLADGRKKPIIVRERSIANMTADLRLRQKQEQKLPPYSQAFSSQDSQEKTTDEYLKMLEQGWPEALDGITDIDGIQTSVPDVFGFEQNVAGAFVNVPEFIAGNPEYMLNPVYQPAETRLVTLVVNSSYSWRVDEGAVIDYAHEIMRAVASLAAQQIEVAVVSVNFTLVHNNRHVVYYTTLREQGSIWQPERIAAYLHPCYLRRLLFATKESDYYNRDKSEMSKVADGMGQSRVLTEDQLAELFPETGSVIMLPTLGTTSPGNAIEAALNIDLGGAS